MDTFLSTGPSELVSFGAGKWLRKKT